MLYIHFFVKIWICPTVKDLDQLIVFRSLVGVGEVFCVDSHRFVNDKMFSGCENRLFFDHVSCQIPLL